VRLVREYRVGPSWRYGLVHWGSVDRNIVALLGRVRP
jgi:hypothetical protein